MWIILISADMCYEPMFEQNCQKSEWRFYFDMKSGICAGKMACPGGANNFKTWQQCHDGCQKFMKNYS